MKNDLFVTREQIKELLNLNKTLALTSKHITPIIKDIFSINFLLLFLISKSCKLPAIIGNHIKTLNNGRLVVIFLSLT